MVLRFESFWRSMWNRKNEKYYVFCTIILLSVLCSVFLYRVCLERVFQSFKDLWSSLVYYFSFILGGSPDSVSVNELPRVSIAEYLPFDLEVVKAKLEVYWSVFFSGETLEGYIDAIFIVLTNSPHFS